MLVCGFQIALNNSDTRRLWMGQNPINGFFHEFRIVHTFLNMYFKLNFAELDMLCNVAKKTSIRSPRRLSRSLFVTQVSTDIFALERQTSVPKGCLKKVFIGMVTLDYLVELLPVIKATYLSTNMDQSQKILESFVSEIGMQFEGRMPSIMEITLWFAEKSRVETDPGTIFNLRSELVLNFRDFLLMEVSKYITTVQETNRWHV